jgi:hypothetical protein
MLTAAPEKPSALTRRVASGVVIAAGILVFAATSRPSESPRISSTARVSPLEMPGPNAGADRAFNVERAERAEHAVRQNLACEGCHADIAAEWRSSHHRSAYTDEPFQRALAAENQNLSFCRGCHAPEAPPNAPPPADLAAIGVACTSCHVTGADILAAPATNPSTAPHPSRRADAFASASACAGCHEFDFPDSALRPQPEKMQLTVTEHAASGYNEAACSGCHMPFVGEGKGRHRSHAFASSRSVDGHRRALTISAERIATSIEITLGPGEVGHAFPTGDLFRRLAVTAEAVGADREMLVSQTRYLARHFRPQVLPSGQKVRTTFADDRPGAPAGAGEPVTVRFDLGPVARGRAAVVRVIYQRVGHVLDGFEKAAVVESEAVLFEHELTEPAAGERAEEKVYENATSR